MSDPRRRLLGGVVAGAAALVLPTSGGVPAFGQPLSNAGAPVRARHAVIVSWDGAKPAVMRHARLPHLDALRRAGAWTYRARTIQPSVTLPSHTSMLSGCMPAKHRITWNDHRPRRGYVSVPTIFSVAKAAGLSTVMAVTKVKLRHIARPGTVDRFILPGATAAKLNQRLLPFLEKNRPRVLFIHFSEPDTAGHDKGWGTPEQIRALEESDRQLGRVIQALKSNGMWDETLMIVSADHGGHKKTHGTTADEDTEIPWVCAGAGVAPVGKLEVPVSTVDTAATAAAALGLARPAVWDGRPVPEVLVSSTVANAR